VVFPPHNTSQWYVQLLEFPRSSSPPQNRRLVNSLSSRVELPVRCLARSLPRQFVVFLIRRLVNSSSCQFVVLSIRRLVNSSSCQFVVLSIRRLVNSSSCQFVVYSDCASTRSSSSASANLCVLHSPSSTIFPSPVIHPLSASYLGIAYLQQPTYLQQHPTFNYLRPYSLYR
jgi:hypothetical protein